LADVDDIAARVGRASGWGANRVTSETAHLKSTLCRELGALAHDLPAKPNSRR